MVATDTPLRINGREVIGTSVYYVFIPKNMTIVILHGVRKLTTIFHVFNKIPKVFGIGMNLGFRFAYVQITTFRNNTLAFCFKKKTKST